MKSTIKKQLGDIGENAAVKYLVNIGYQILDRNFTNYNGLKLGEIDIIAKDIKNDELVFVGVKTRNFEKYMDTLPEENITHSKLIRLSKIAEVYLRQKSLVDYPFRFDALSVWIDKSGKMLKIRHIENI